MGDCTIVLTRGPITESNANWEKIRYLLFILGSRGTDWGRQMGQTSKGKMRNDVRQHLEEMLVRLLSNFRSIKDKLGSARSFAHTLFMLSEPDYHELVFDDVCKQLRETEAHKELVDFFGNRQYLWEEPSAGFTSSDAHIFQLYVSAVLLRVMASVDANAEKSKNPLLEFIDFLDQPDVPRHVEVPLLHLNMVQNSYDLGDFGTLVKRTLPNEIIPESVLENLDVPTPIVFSFTVRTGHFYRGTKFPLSDILKAKVGLLRLGVYPLIAYNHFSVEHVKPWEQRISDNDFSGRHWSKEGPISRSIRQHSITDGDVERIISLQKSFRHMGWESMSSWRLAMDRLDDASFKLECGSPDAILDLVIGLESVFVDRDSRQESTHKVSIRVSRFLEATLTKRKDMFHKVKQMYKDRSTLAHGQRWNLDEHAVARVESAATLLGRVLEKMVELESVNLDLDTLDLS